MSKFRVRVNGSAEFEIMSNATSASAAADELRLHKREGDGNDHEIRFFWDQVAVLEVTKVSD
jgi:hypothetical protein